MRIILLLLLSVFAVNMQSQNIVKSLERYVPGQGKVTIHQDPRIEALLGTEHKVGGDQTFFTSPRWLCRVGDFRSIEEADAMMRKLRATGIFREVSIVKDQINIPL